MKECVNLTQSECTDLYLWPFAGQLVMAFSALQTGKVTLLNFQAMV